MSQSPLANRQQLSRDSRPPRVNVRAVVTQMKPLIRVQDYVDPVDRALFSGTFVRSTQVKKSHESMHL